MKQAGYTAFSPWIWCTSDNKVVPITPKDCQSFLTTSFSHCTAKTSSMTQLTESLSELGIALLELWRGVGLKDRYPGKLGKGTVLNTFMHKACAREWIEQESSVRPASYHSAVCRCLMGLMRDDSSLPSWDDQRFREAYCEGVVFPLSQLYHDTNKTSSGR